MLHVLAVTYRKNAASSAQKRLNIHSASGLFLPVEFCVRSVVDINERGVHCGKTADLTEMRQRNQVLDGVQIPDGKGEILVEMVLCNVTYRENAASAVQKRQNRSSCCLGW